MQGSKVMPKFNAGYQWWCCNGDGGLVLELLQ
jgi:hypothetical protein